MHGRIGRAVSLLSSNVLSFRQRRSAKSATLSPTLEGYQLRRNPEALNDLTGHIIRRGDSPVASGGFADVWSGIWSDKARARKVGLAMGFGMYG